MTDVEREFGRVYALWNGPSARRDYRRAVALLRPLSDGGFAPATFALAMAYYDGHGVRKDLEETFRLMKVAAEASYPSAQNMLAAMYGSSYPRRRTWPHDETQAVRWFELAARNGNPSAQHNLAVRSRDGLGAPRSLERAYVWACLSVHCSPVPFRPAEVLRDQLRPSLSPDELASAEVAIAQLSADLPREQSEHLHYWRQCAERAND